MIGHGGGGGGGGRCQNAQNQKQNIIKTYLELILYKPAGKYQNINLLYLCANSKYFLTPHRCSSFTCFNESEACQHEDIYIYMPLSMAQSYNASLYF